MQTIETSRSISLRNLFEGFCASGVKFREKVCEECGWSESTFYRKMRQGKIEDPNRPGRMINTISIAESEKIKDLAWEVQQDLKDLL
ncbi:hypothetical protein [Chitinophaga arvensicola]|uniref:Uncharacterized protein n=1 Tax=Chitinophaga arvensicola TaxID=29529 RepID=A0A1I0PHV6_9BACT|nr:hypothetical protein [Chitinophaga arvensicola]SEW14040.1 hypothetical protein SAMN04488122_0796 [Chitinophaga arvensicola]